MINLLFNFKDCYTNKATNNGIALEYIYRFLELFQQIQNYDSTYNVIDSIKTLQGVFKDLLRKETLDFKGSLKRFTNNGHVRISCFRLRDCGHRVR